jgi:hypothetical protein
MRRLGLPRAPLASTTPEGGMVVLLNREQGMELLLPLVLVGGVLFGLGFWVGLRRRA